MKALVKRGINPAQKRRQIRQENILLVAAATFWLFRMVVVAAGVEKKRILHRFSFPLICFAIVASFLTYTLIRIADDHHLNELIVNTLEKQLLKYPDVELDISKYDEKDDIVYVLAKIHSSKAAEPHLFTIP